MKSEELEDQLGHMADGITSRGLEEMSQHELGVLTVTVLMAIFRTNIEILKKLETNND